MRGLTEGQKLEGFRAGIKKAAQIRASFTGLASGKICQKEGERKEKEKKSWKGKLAPKEGEGTGKTRPSEEEHPMKMQSNVWLFGAHELFLRGYKVEKKVRIEGKQIR